MDPDANHAPGCDSDTAHAQAHDVSELPPFTLKDKGKTPVRDGHSAFRPSPYARPPSSVSSVASSLKISNSVPSTSASTKIISSSSAKDPFSAQFEELDRQSQALLDIGGSTSSSAVRYNYAIRKKELEYQREERLAKQASAETEFMREQELRKLDIRLKEQEERAYDRQIQVLRLQIEYQHAMSAHASAAGPSFTAPPAAPPGPLFTAPSAPPPGPSFALTGLSSSLPFAPAPSTTPFTAGRPPSFPGSSSSPGGV